MLTRAQKRVKCDGFIQSEKFGLETYNTIFLYSVNIAYVIETVKIYDTLVQRLGTKDFPTDHNEHRILRLKQYVMLDAISRLQAGIESTLVLVDELSNGYSKVASAMTFYHFERVRNIVRKILENEKPYCMRKVLGLPNVSDLGLIPQQRKVLSKIYAETEEIMLYYIKKLARFYDKYRILYGKHKHGLTIEAGSGMMPLQVLPAFEDSILFAYDHKEYRDMPINPITVKENKLTISNWFNVQSLLKFNMRANQELWETISCLHDIAGFVSQNHLDYALNCGEGYLPTVEARSKEVGITFFMKTPLDADETEVANSIAHKLIPNMNLGRKNLNISHNLNTDTTLLNSIIYDSVTNLWFGKK